jgi:hypothetical protein
MQLSHSHRFIFVHILKTAGESIRAVLEPYAFRPERSLPNRIRIRLGLPARPFCPGLAKHARATEIRDALPQRVFGSYYKFAFVRNPWDWQVSWYHYILQRPGHEEHGAVRPLGGFEQYLSWRSDNYPALRQKDFVADERGELIVDFVGRFETLADDFARVCAATGVRANLPHLNRTRHDDYRTYYSDRACRLVADYCREDIEYFGYGFDRAREAATLPLTSPAPVRAVPSFRAAA